MTTAAWLRVLLLPLIGLTLVMWLPGVFTPKDFTEYWSAAAVLAHGGDPYDGEQLLPWQQPFTGHAETKVVSLWTPPWTLPLYLPFGYLPYDTARHLWLGLQLLMVAVSVEMLGRIYGGCRPPVATSRVLGYLPHLVTLAFAPTFWMTNFGQNTGFLILGLAGFLYFRDSRPYIAGCFAALTAVKPHLLAAFGVVLILDVFRPKGWKVLAAGVGTLVVGSLVALAVNSHIFDQFISAVRRPATAETVPLSEWNLPLISHKIRHKIDPGRFWIQFVPSAVACVGMAAFKLVRGSRWHWPTMLPVAVLVSCLTAPYGGWIFDLVVLLVPVIHATAMLLHRRPTVWVIAVAIGLIHVSWFGFLIRSLDAPIWFTPAITALYAVVARVNRGD